MRCWVNAACRELAAGPLHTAFTNSCINMRKRAGGVSPPLFLCGQKNIQGFISVGV